MNDANEKMTAERVRQALHGLSAHWELMVRALSPQEQARMKKPLFSVRDMKSSLGTWSLHKREICLSLDLVLNHTWDSVLEVLAHETAHQYAHQVLGASRETDHGPAFHRACERLGADPRASGGFRPLDERIRFPESEAEDAPIRKVRKLLALAESRNRHEAEAAMAKAHSLIRKYAIKDIEHNENRRFVSAFLGSPALRHPREEYAPAHLLIEHYFVSGIWVSAFVLGREKMGRVLEISGTPENVRIASYVYEVVRGYIAREWEKFTAGKRASRRLQTDFSVGVVEGFRSTLEKEAEKEEAGLSASRALVSVDDPALSAYLKKRHPRIRTTRKQCMELDAHAFRQGEKSGERLVIRPGVEKTGGRTGKITG